MIFFKTTLTAILFFLIAIVPANSCIFSPGTVVWKDQMNESKTFIFMGRIADVREYEAIESRSCVSVEFDVDEILFGRNSHPAEYAYCGPSDSADIADEIKRLENNGFDKGTKVLMGLASVGYSADTFELISELGPLNLACQLIMLNLDKASDEEVHVLQHHIKSVIGSLN